MMNRTFWLFLRDAFRFLTGFCLTVILAFAAAFSWGAAESTNEAEADDARESSVRLSIEGISASVGEDEPRVLNILPWRAPTLPRRPSAELKGSASDLVQPLDAIVLERHRVFRQSLGGSHHGPQPGARR
ncbi:hypothetical protein [Marinobacter salexigens]|uniref:Uncharacterized protein n=1 Tax=Marinobacter salexigens TaxID=1925763 RepID=A0ABS6AB62_9GAMM|nr:hypothetical protein [Marinobacter salexigens]MBU2875207.1 hypothetical protein [Marinobacter salexigens]